MTNVACALVVPTSSPDQVDNETPDSFRFRPACLKPVGLWGITDHVPETLVESAAAASDAKRPVTATAMQTRKTFETPDTACSSLSWAFGRSTHRLDATVGGAGCRLVRGIPEPETTSGRSRLGFARALCHDRPVGTTVLIVDDHPTFRRFARRLLEHAGFAVV